MLPPRDDPRHHRDQVAAYYDQSTAAYVDAVGPTLQAAMIDAADGEVSLAATNAWLARRMGVQAGMRLLDAGCGVGGPAMDIAAAWPDLRIDGVTISAEQARLARERVEHAGLGDRVAIRQGDYHTLPYPDSTFDVVAFLESAGHSDDPETMFREAWRVLRTGGRLYVKDLFLRVEADPTPRQLAEQRQFDRIFRYRTPRSGSWAELLARIGYMGVRCTDLDDRASTRHFTDAMVDRDADGRVRLTAFGRDHYWVFAEMPVVCRELTAVRPFVAGGRPVPPPAPAG